MKQASNDQILIAGGGIGGLAAALALARIGKESHVFEQADEIKEIGAGIQLGPNAFYTFDELGISDEVNKLAVFPDDIIAMDAISGEEILRLPVSELYPERFGKPYGLIHRADLHAVLLQACRDSGKVTLSASSKVESHVSDGKSVTVTTADGQTHTGPALIGADGLWSTVRQVLLTMVNQGFQGISPTGPSYLLTRFPKPTGNMPW